MAGIEEKLDQIINQTQGDEVLWAAAIGAGAALIPQIIGWIIKATRQKNQDKLEIISDLHRLKHLLKDHYRELALHKAHKFYWYAQYEAADNNKDEDQFYNSHMKSIANVRETELKIATTFSEFYKLVIKYQHITKFDNKVKSLVEEFYDFKPAKPSYLDTSKADLPKQENKEEERLNKEYDKVLKIIGKIVKQLQKK